MDKKEEQGVPTPKDNVRVISLAEYNIPQVEEKQGQSWVEFGEDNDYFGKLIEAFTSSPTNSACVSGIIDMIYGKGLAVSDLTDEASDYAAMKLLLKNREVKRLVHDYYMLGQGALQVIYNKRKTKILKVKHFPMETLRAEKAVNGVIKAYYYNPDWANYNPSQKPKRIPTFGNGSKSQQQELYIFKPYRSGFYYYATVEYQGCLEYALMEQEVANYHINNIRNAMQPSLLINFNNGIPNAETQTLIERKIADKFTGTSNAGRFIMAFNDSKETQADIQPIHLPDAHAQYQFISDECREKIMIGHRVVSPILMGIKEDTGFGNNAEELRNSSIIMDNTVINPRQEEITKGLEEILAFNGIYLDLYFITNQPIEFSDLDNVQTDVRREKETGEKLSSVELNDFSDEEGDDMASQLEGLGEVISDDWELVHTEEVKDAETHLKKTAEPYKESAQDNNNYKVRYAYMPVRKNPKSRKFCKHLEEFTSNNIVFRKEDINQMSFRGVNRELGHKKQNYSLFKFKGGVNCHHFWEMRVYKKKVDEGNIVSEESAIRDGMDKPNNDANVIVKPKDMPNQGRYPK